MQKSCQFLYIEAIGDKDTNIYCLIDYIR